MSDAQSPAAPALFDTANEPPAPVLRTLAPLLRGLEKRLRTWLDARRRFPLSMMQRAELEGLADDLRRQGETLDVEKPLLVVMLMGGTGVGKSTLLNALAGGPIAQASFTRPTTRDPVVYFHHNIKSDRLDPALRVCRLVQHDRAGLEQKVIVDTPDIDSNDLSNRDKLLALLPVADVVLYVGSQEKYHDKLGWDLFKAQRQRRAFAFVLNKWDRCNTGESGLRPDEDLLNDLRSEGFENPLLFRTTAQLWLESAQKYQGNGPIPKPPDLPEGEQFSLLRNWLELGITRLEIEAVKARGVGQLLTQLARTADEIRPPDLTAEAGKVKGVWEKTLAEEASVQADVLVGTLEPYQTEVEHHFSVEDQARFRGLMAAYLRLTTRLRYAGSGLRDRMPFGLKGRLLGGKVETPVEWNLGAFVQECARTAGERVLDQRATALINRLLVEGDAKNFPLTLLSDPTNAAGRLDWRERMTRAVIDALAEVEHRATHPTGWRKVVRGTIGAFANTLPEIALIATAGVLLWNFFVHNEVPDMFRMSFVVLIPLLVVVVFHFLILFFMNLRWPTIRAEFRTVLGERMAAELDRAYLSIPDEVAAAIRDERKQVDELIAETKQVSEWLAERQQAARVAELYGK
jgi:hypothetical protein